MNWYYWQRDTIIEAIRAWTQRHGRAPTTFDFDGPWGSQIGALPSSTTVRKFFPALADARQAADVAAGYRRRAKSERAGMAAPVETQYGVYEDEERTHG